MDENQMYQRVETLEQEVWNLRTAQRELLQLLRTSAGLSLANQNQIANILSQIPQPGVRVIYPRA